MKMVRSDRLVGWVERSDTHPTTCARVIAAFIPGRGRAPSRHVFVISGGLVGRSLQRFRRPRSAEKGDLCGAARALRGCITIVLDPAGFLTRLGTDHICGLRHKFHGGFHPSGMSRGEMGFDCNRAIETSRSEERRVGKECRARRVPEY